MPDKSVLGSIAMLVAKSILENLQWKLRAAGKNAAEAEFLIIFSFV